MDVKKLYDLLFNLYSKQENIKIKYEVSKRK